MPTFFNKPFASGGTRTTVPSAQQSDGNMSFTEGYGADYERNTLTDNKAKHIERGQMNYLFFIITEAIGEIQRLGSSTWEEAKTPYDQGSTCYYNNASWVSIISNNKDKPGITANWVKLGSVTSNGTSGTVNGYTKEEINAMVATINSSLAAINVHENGDIYPISRHALLSNEYVCNGETIPILSSAGSVLKSMSESYKTSWGVKQIGTQRIKLPTVINKNEQADYLSTLLFSRTPGSDRSEIYDYYLEAAGLDKAATIGGYEIPVIHHNVSRFIPAVWLNSNNKVNTDGYTLYLEGTDNTEPTKTGEVVIQQLRFGVYNNGVKYRSDDNFKVTLKKLVFKNKAGEAVPSPNPIVSMTEAAAGSTIMVTLSTACTVYTADVILWVEVDDVYDDSSQSVINKEMTIELTNEQLI